MPQDNLMHADGVTVKSGEKKAIVGPPWLQVNQSEAKSADSAWARELARISGLAVAGIATARAMPELESYLHWHVDCGNLDGLDWFTKERASFSSDPRNLHPRAESIISVGLPYYMADPGKPQDGVPRGRIARYARGADYHRILKRRMQHFHSALEERAGRRIEARLLVDTARIVDRAAAAVAGVGWYGKNSCIIVPGYGSWVLLGEMIVDLELEPDQQLAKSCGRCSICIDNCPTGAIIAPYTIRTPSCISFQTIEQRGPIPLELRSRMSDWVFGCDVCQEVCPYTGAASEVVDDDIAPKSDRHSYPSLLWLLTMTEEDFRSTYRGMAVLRAKRRGLARNAAVALGNTGDVGNLLPLRDALRAHDEPLVRGHAAWGLGHIGGTRANRFLHEAWLTESDEYVRSEIALALD